MKAVRRFSGFWGAMALCTAVCLGAVGMVTAQTGAQYCEITLSECPEWYDTKTITVPLDVVSISAGVKACNISALDTSKVQGGSATPAIMFLVDHTTSMTNNNGNDPNGNRFRVTRALIDTIYRVVPDAQIGLALFGPGFLFGPARDSNVVAFTYYNTTDYTPALTGPVTHDRATQYFLPLLPLDRSVRPGFARVANNPTAYDLYRDMFYIPANANTRAGVRANNTNNNLIAEVGGTNITIAFEAAIQEFTRLNAARGISKENQYIIFLSDGEPSPRVDQCGTSANSNNPRCPMQNDFINITSKYVPTTYTVFLTTNPNAGAPAALVSMTENIKANGYSSTNPTSFIEAISADYNALLELMMSRIVTPMLSKSNGTPSRVVISSAGVADSAGTITDSGFTFRRSLPLDTNVVTTVAMDIRYRVTVDSTWTKLDGRDTTTVVRIVPDSLFKYSFQVRRTENPPANWATTQGITSKCGAKPTLTLRYQNTTIATSSDPAKQDTIKGSMNVLTIEFKNEGGLFDYGNSVRVQVMNTEGDLIDVENFTLTRGTGANSNTYTFTFPREVSDRQTSGNGRLEHSGQDSIVVFFRNPYIPLDTLRISAPFMSHTMSFYEKRDANVKDTIPFAITVKAGDTTNIFARLINTEGEAEQWGGKFDTKNVTWTISSREGVQVFESGADSAKFMGTTAGRTYTVTATYKEGSMEIKRTVQITVVPGDPEYVEIVVPGKDIAAKADTNALKQNKNFTFEKGVDVTTFLVVERDRYGNLIGPATGSTWGSNEPGVISTTPTISADSAAIRRLGNDFTKELYVTACKNGVGCDTVKITVVGEPAGAVGPNPFVPGRDSPKDYLLTFGIKGQEAYDQVYKDIIEGPGIGGSSGGEKKGILIAATAPMTVKTSGTGGGGSGTKFAKATAVIYDAVGNVVWRSKENDIILAKDGVTLGFVWEGKNSKGRKVAPGTYLIKMVAVMYDGRGGEKKEPYTFKIGVTK